MSTTPDLEPKDAASLVDDAMARCRAGQRVLVVTRTGVGARILLAELATQLRAGERAWRTQGDERIASPS